MFKKKNEVKIEETPKKKDILDEEKYTEQNRLVEYLQKRNKELEEKSTKSVEDLAKEKETNIKSNLEVETAKAKRELADMQLNDIKAVLEQYRQLPDLKNMIDNLSSLTTPSIDKLVEVVSKTNFKDMINLADKVSEMDKKIDTLINIFSSRRMY